MHFKLTHQLPEKCIVACSGGPDSVAALHWLARADKVAEIIYVHHNSGKFANDSELIVRANVNIIDPIHHPKLTTYYIDQPLPSSNLEEWWRERRYQFLDNHPDDLPIVLAHHLNDCVEEYITCALVRGYLGTIPYRRGRCIRPFRTCTKQDMIDFCARNEYPYILDPTNNKGRRGLYRQHLIPWFKDHINDGIENMVRRMIEDGLGDNDAETRKDPAGSRGANLAAAIEPEEPRRQDSRARVLSSDNSRSSGERAAQATSEGSDRNPL